ncbi:nucleoporin Ndc1 [Drosophila erecta]|uniref:Nucleoporin Ndc1 n=1 Tax=Drosophila erecta TaxID=7220 RepID=B3NC62_DROER|nr:nucleoporin Ndc1 [Drosophila erecta]EDV50950.2 uncharacterized protein Dere_GG15240 [Drosophila erecta]
MSILKLPQYYLLLPRKIKKILLYRFLFATLLCSWLDYQMLTIFVSINLFEVRRPLVSLTEILRWTLFSVYSSVAMLLIRLSMMGFGLVLCHTHYVYPRCYGYNLLRLTYEFPKRFCLISSILSITIATSWLYASFVDLNNRNQLLGGSWYYLMTFGCFCGIAYYHKCHKICLRRFPLPIVHLDMKECLLQSWCHQLKSSAKTALVPTLLFALIYWPTMGFLETSELGGVSTGCFVIITQPQRLFQAWLLATLILAKLHIIRELYGLIMQRKLTMICDLRELHEHIDINLFNLIWERFQYFFYMMQMKPMPMDVQRYNLSLPIAMALDTTEIYGFQLLAARDFYAAMSGSLCNELFKKRFCQRNRHWAELRDVVLGMLDQFLTRIESCLEPTPRIKVCHLLKNKNPNEPRIRSLVKKTPAPRRLCVHSTWNGLWLRLAVAPQYYSFLYEADQLAKLNHELRCGEPLVWILQGLVSICVRFPNEDKFRYPPCDLERILVYLLRVEEKLIAAKEMQVRGKLCSSHDHLMMAINRCLYKMLFTFGPHLDCIFDDVNLRATFKRRMELIP